jgi:cellulose synthase/poly-beta-1,6-N-acetylglucosamine synthase-like glycosyltransferase
MGDQGRGFAGNGRSREAIPNRILARMRRAAQQAGAPQLQPRLHPPPAPHEYAFLVGPLIDQATLGWAEAEALDCGVATHEVLLAAGWVSQDDYAAALAHKLGVPVVAWDVELDLTDTALGQAPGIGVPARRDGRPCRVLAATEATPDALLRHIAALRARGIEVALASRRRIDAAYEACGQAEWIDRAVGGLLRARPAMSAGTRDATWQVLTAAVAVGLIMGGLVVLPDATIAAVTALIAFPFLCVTLLRLFALHQAVIGPERRVRLERPQSPGHPDWMLPVYTVLVPLVREAGMLPGLVQSLCALDYPQPKLEIFLVLEAADAETQAAVLNLALPGNFRTLVVPDQAPHTKPKALNYALPFARGDFVVVYDAEDRPEPDQLRRAWEVFQHAPPELGCLQAQLNIDNPRQSWFTRQFTIEYSALFDAILPALERLRLPVPLGGSSNHFPRATLISAGAWDPHNVTEDADLGIRLARQGYHTGVLASTTWEEAPPIFSVWLKQRTRWLKGWLQTYLVHTRDLGRLNRDLGLRAAIGFHALMGGLIVSALVHPLFYVLLAWHWLAGELLAPAETTAGAVLWTIAWINLGVGYVVSILVGVLSVWRRGHLGLAAHALLMPLYWLLISFAAYRAVYQFVRDPYLWEKTEHGVGAGRARRGSR